jgi:enoyl-CoA hydratase/carnithine racemase
MFQSLPTSLQSGKALGERHRIFNKIESASKPIAAVNGFALGAV